MQATPARGRSRRSRFIPSSPTRDRRLVRLIERKVDGASDYVLCGTTVFRANVFADQERLRREHVQAQRDAFARHPLDIRDAELAVDAAARDAKVAGAAVCDANHGPVDVFRRTERWARRAELELRIAEARAKSLSETVPVEVGEFVSRVSHAWTPPYAQKVRPNMGQLLAQPLLTCTSPRRRIRAVNRAAIYMPQVTT